MAMISSGNGRSGGRGRRRRGGHAVMSDINVTPFVDVMLVLLVIFMVTAPMMQSAVPVELPDSRAEPLAQSTEQTEIVLDSQGNIHLNGDPIEIGKLQSELAMLPARADGRRPAVTLRADRRLDYGRVMAVMGELNYAGITEISLVTDSGGAPEGR